MLGFFATYLFAMDLLTNRGRPMTLTRATSWSIMYVVAALLFAGYIWSQRGPNDAQLFLTAYMLEKVLSVDNLVVFAAVFGYFGIAHQHRHRILRWGIIGAATMRLGFVYAGTEMFQAAEAYMSLVFACFIAYAGVIVLQGKATENVDHSKRWYSRILTRWFPLAEGPYTEGKFLVRCFYFKERVYWCITPSLLCLVAIEMSDIAFAVDSVPVVVAVARDPFIIYSAMIYAIMGLRALYFVLDALQAALRYMNQAVALVLFFVAIKLVASVWGLHIPPFRSLAVVVGVLTMGVLASLWSNRYARP